MNRFDWLKVIFWRSDSGFAPPALPNPGGRTIKSPPELGDLGGVQVTN